MPNILVLGGGVESYEGVEHIKELGHKVVLCDIDEHAPCRSISDFFIKASIYNENEVLEGVTQFFKSGGKIDGVLAIATDTPKSVAKVAKEFGLPSISYETAILATDKLKMKQRFIKSGIKTPIFYEIKNFKDLEEIVKQNKEKKFVLKPADSRGARGVLIIDYSSNLKSSFNHSLSFSKSKRLILEEWIEGPQLSVESVIWDNEYFLCGVADRNYSRLDETYPYVIEDGGETPSKFQNRFWSDLNDLMFRCAKSIGLNRGTIKGDIVIGKNGIYVIEIAARLSGGYFSTITIPAVYGNDIIKAAVDISLGKKPNFKNFTKENKKYQANRFLFLKPGTVKEVNFEEKNILNDTMVKKFFLNVKVGDVIHTIDNHTKRYGMVLCVGDKMNYVVQKCETIISKLESSIIIK